MSMREMNLVFTRQLFLLRNIEKVKRVRQRLLTKRKALKSGALLKASMSKDNGKGKCTYHRCLLLSYNQPGALTMCCVMTTVGTAWIGMWRNRWCMWYFSCSLCLYVTWSREMSHLSNFNSHFLKTSKCFILIGANPITIGYLTAELWRNCQR